MQDAQNHHLRIKTQIPVFHKPLDIIDLCVIQKNIWKIFEVFFKSIRVDFQRVKY